MITEQQLVEAIRAFENDIDEGRLVRVAVDWPEAFLETERLSRSFTPQLLCRSLDVLHVAVAARMGCSRLITGDSRQARLARAAGLRPVTLAADKP